MTSNKISGLLTRSSRSLIAIRFHLAASSRFEVSEFSKESNWPKLNEDVLKFHLIATLADHSDNTSPNRDAYWEYFIISDVY